MLLSRSKGAQFLLLCTFLLAGACLACIPFGMTPEEAKHCKSLELKRIIEKNIGGDPEKASKFITLDMNRKFKKDRAQTICSRGHVAWNLWYGKHHYCSLTRKAMTCIAWLD